MTGPDEATIKWLLTRIGNHFKSNQICFYSNQVFQLPEFKKKFFLSEFDWLVLRGTVS